MKRTLQRPSVVNGMKWCPSCKRWLTFDHFGMDKQNTHGLKCYCKACYEDKRKAIALRYREENRCVICGRISDGNMRCEVCRSKNSVVTVARLEHRRQHHLCLTCGKELDPSYHMVRCPKCNAGRKRNRDALTSQRLNQGLCIHCGQPTKDSALCPDCSGRKLALRKSRVDKAREAGICTRCLSKPADPGFRRCSECRTKTARLEAARKSNHRRV